MKAQNKFLTLFVLLALMFGVMGVSSAEAAGGQAVVTPADRPVTLPGRKTPDPAGAVLHLKVNQTGMYRVTYEMLREAGLDLAGVKSSLISLYNAGQEIPIYMKAKGTFGPGDYFEFYGQALDTLYTDTNVYTLTIKRTRAARILEDNVRAPSGQASPAFYLEKTTTNRQRAYASYAPGADPWYDTEMVALTNPVSRDFTVQLDHLAEGTASNLELTVWGVTNWPASPDHHLLVSVNGVSLADEWFDGLTENKLTFDLPAGVLREGENTLQLTLAGDTGQEADVVALDGYTVTYARAFRAREGRLAFTATGEAFTVTGLPGADVTVYRLAGTDIVRLGRVMGSAKMGAATGDAYSITFAGSSTEATYLVTSVPNLYAPVFEAVRAPANLDVPAQYLVIAHPLFLDGLQPLAAARQAQGLTVNVVDVNDVYARYSYGVFDPQAIREYIAYAKQNLGTQYILLVGGDTYDYRNYLGLDSVSFIPSLYVSTGAGSNFVPSDPLYADVDNNHVPDVAIGRFPVRTAADLDRMIEKTLAYEVKDYTRTAVFASDYADGSSFKSLSNLIAATLPADWSVQSFHMDTLGVSAVRAQLVEAMNRGTALAVYTGHATPTAWTYSSLFTTDTAAALTNAGRPFVAVQWGCWSNYDVDPSRTDLVQALLFSGDRGAVATLGATTLLRSSSIVKLGRLLMPRLATPGMTIGQAVRDAKVELETVKPGLLDAQLGWVLMGDPALVIQP